jgi:hypothetical protein
MLATSKAAMRETTPKTPRINPLLNPRHPQKITVPTTAASIKKVAII